VQASLRRKTDERRATKTGRERRGPDRCGPRHKAERVRGSSAPPLGQTGTAVMRGHLLLHPRQGARWLLGPRDVCSSAAGHRRGEHGVRGAPEEAKTEKSQVRRQKTLQHEGGYKKAQPARPGANVLLRLGVLPCLEGQRGRMHGLVGESHDLVALLGIGKSWEDKCARLPAQQLHEAPKEGRGAEERSKRLRGEKRRRAGRRSGSPGKREDRKAKTSEFLHCGRAS